MHLSRRDAFQRWIADTETCGHVELDAAGRIASWSSAAERISGYSEAEAVGKDWADFTTPSALTAGRHRNVLVRKDGQLRPLDVRCAELRDAEGTLLGFGMLLQDLEVETALRSSELRYRAFVDHATDTLMLHRNGTLVDVNRFACESLGYTRDELIGRSPQDFDPDITPAALAALVERLGNGESVAFDTRHQRKDGSTFPVEVRIQPFLMDGKVHAISLARDISERKQAESELRAALEALRVSEDRFQLALQGANDGLWDWNLLTDEVFFSPRWKSMLGYSEDELPGRVETWRELLHPDDRPVAEARVGAFLAREIDKYEVEFRLRHKDGSYRNILARGVAARDAEGRPVRMVGTHVDITERVAQSAALRASEDRLRRAQAIGRVGSWSYDLATDRFQLSEEAQRMSGLADGANRDALLAIFHPADRARFESAWQLALEGSPLEIELRVLVNRALRWVYVRAATERDPNGGPVAITGTSHEITDRKRLEEQFHQAQKMETVGQLAGGIAHDFNNLLTVISCSVDVLSESMPADDPLREELIEIRHATVGATDLTHQLLAFSRKQILEPRLMDLNDLVAQREKMLSRLIGEDIRIVTSLGRTVQRIFADPGQLEQVLINLLVNARDAMPTGGRLTISTRDLVVAEADMGALAPGRYVDLTVADTGCGFDDDVKAKLFEPFFTTKAVGKGTGLGLPLVYGIVKQSGGHIFVDSAVGLGSTFRIVLPIAEPAARASREDAREDANPNGKETILLVEDDDALRRLERLVLVKHGYTVLEASGSAVAIELAHQRGGDIDLLVTDVVMPEMSGRQLADHLRAMLPGLRVLFLSGYTDDAVLRHGVSAGTDPFLQKPFTPQALAARVRAVLDRV